MSRKSRERMMHGVSVRSISPAKRARLMETMRQASESDREGVRRFLRRDGSRDALALLEEFEREWDQQPIPGRAR